MRALLLLTLLSALGGRPCPAAPGFRHFEPPTLTPLLGAPSPQTIHWEAPGVEGTVLVFLSSVCPCSRGHEPSLRDLARDFPQFRFVGLVANPEEDRAAIVEHFSKAKLPFFLAADFDQQQARRWGALKTPHVFVIDRHGNERYRGGVDNSHQVEKATAFYLRDALTSLHTGQPIATPESKPLGCPIQ